jgi:hypothetical protein
MVVLPRLELLHNDDGRQIGSYGWWRLAHSSFKSAIVSSKSLWSVLHSDTQGVWPTRAMVVEIRHRVGFGALSQDWGKQFRGEYQEPRAGG